MRKILIKIILCLFLTSGLHAKSEQTPKDIDTQALQEQVKNNKNLVLIDVRTPGEIELLGGSIDHQGDINIPRGWLEFRIKDEVPDLNTPIVVYCGTNVRSPVAAKTLIEMGYTQVQNYAGGFVDWKKSNWL